MVSSIPSYCMCYHWEKLLLIIFLFFFSLLHFTLKVLECLVNSLFSPFPYNLDFVLLTPRLFFFTHIIYDFLIVRIIWSIWCSCNWPVHSNVIMSLKAKNKLSVYSSFYALLSSWIWMDIALLFIFLYIPFLLS